MATTEAPTIVDKLGSQNMVFTESGWKGDWAACREHYMQLAGDESLSEIERFAAKVNVAVSDGRLGKKQEAVDSRKALVVEAQQIVDRLNSEKPNSEELFCAQTILLNIVTHQIYDSLNAESKSDRVKTKNRMQAYDLREKHEALAKLLEKKHAVIDRHYQAVLAAISDFYGASATVLLEIAKHQEDPKEKEPNFNAAGMFLNKMFGNAMLLYRGSSDDIAARFTRVRALARAYLIRSEVDAINPDYMGVYTHPADLLMAAFKLEQSELMALGYLDAGAIETSYQLAKTVRRSRRKPI